MTHWDNQAKQWALLGLPLKPAPIDIQNCRQWIDAEFGSRKQALSVLILGVTPELVSIPWPHNTTLLAMDYSQEMIQSILPTATPTVTPQSLLCNWLKLPISSSSIDIVLGDGCYSSLAYNDYGILSKEIHRILKPSGTIIMRFFCRPTTKESIQSIHQDILSGHINSFHAFKLKLAMALHHNLDQGVCLKDIWKHWALDFKINLSKYIQQTQWDIDVINTINTYQNSEVIYTFPTLDELRSVLSKTFNEKNIFIPQYYLGQCCPTLRLKPMRLTNENHSI